MLLVSPCLAVSSNHPGRSLPEGGNALGLAPLEDRIQPKLDPGADFPRPLAGCRQRDFGRAAQAKVAPVAIFLRPADPTLAAAGLDHEEQAIAIPDPPGPSCCLHGAGGELSHRSEEHTSELQSLMRISYAVFC